MGINPQPSAHPRISSVRAEWLLAPGMWFGIMPPRGTLWGAAMHFVTPTKIESIAWEGKLVPPSGAGGFRAAFLRVAKRRGPVCAIGKPEVWAAEDAVEPQTGQPWTPPLGGADFWLVRLACTLRDPSGRLEIVEATHSLFLKPVQEAPGAEAYAFSMIPDRLGIEDKANLTFTLGPELKFAGGVEVKAGEIGATIDYRKVFPVIQGYGAGRALCEWKFKPHRAHPIDGTQFVYAVVATRPSSTTAQAHVELSARVDTKLGPVHLGLPKEAKAHVAFAIPE